MVRLVPSDTADLTIFGIYDNPAPTMAHAAIAFNRCVIPVYRHLFFYIGEYKIAHGRNLIIPFRSPILAGHHRGNEAFVLCVFCLTRKPHPTRTKKRGYRDPSLEDLSMARRIFSGVIGRSLILTPTASYTALAMAEATQTILPSPTPLAPKGPVGSWDSTMMESSFGTSFARSSR